MATANPDPVIFAAVGDVHGSHREMVRQVQELAGELDVRPELVLQVGDFEPHRHLDDVESMAAPSRHRSLGDFPDFVAGRERYPWPVVFIGGNHEPYGFLDGQDTPAELVPNCLYLGRAGLVERRGLRIAGLSGIYRPDCWIEGRPSIQDLHRTKKKKYTGYTREDVDRLLELCKDGPPHVLLLHEWPRLELGASEREQLWDYAEQLDPGAASERSDQDLPEIRRVQQVVGSETVLELAQLLEPRLVLCGHVHAPLRTSVPGDDTRITVRTLGKVDIGIGAVAMFRWSAELGIEELS